MSRTARMTGRKWPKTAALIVAIVLLDASLAFQNVWPTPIIRWAGQLSIEFAALLLILAALAVRFAPYSRAVLRTLTIFWLFLTVGHYADVTAPALYGREVNLYWDLRFIPDVAGLLARAGPRWLVAAAIAAVLGATALLYGLLRWAIRQVLVAMDDPVPRAWLTLLASATVMLFVMKSLGTAVPVTFAPPVSATYARQIQLLAAGVTGTAALDSSPSVDSDLTRIHGADVFLVFLESYGAVTFDRAEFSDRLAASRQALAETIRETRRDVVSAFVESPTFGGSSWLAHISLMSGVEVRGPDTNALLMTQKRDTLVTTFARGGYRTVALMPGLWQRWPEGSFYGFDDIYGGARLDYHGPEFGWFDMTDQFALARLDALESARDAKMPLFVFFPTISTHTPFTPTPPYQPDWGRMLSNAPYGADALEQAYARQPDWLDLSPSYVDAVAYALETLNGYLRQHADRDLVVILLGDHQPPALVSGEGAPWDVPVHVIASRPDLLEHLRAHGFASGLVPSRPVLGRMHTLLPVLLDAFGNRPAPVH